MPLTEEYTSYWKTLRVTDPECDLHNRLKLSSILRHMQEISGEHLDALGLPYETLYDMGQVFLLSKIRLELLRRPKSGETLTWRTSPLPPVGAQFVRRNTITDDSGETVLYSDSLWMLVEPHSRRILRPNAFAAKLPVSGSFSREQMNRLRIELPASLSPIWQRETRYSDLDVNRHVNNAAYADFVLDTLPDELVCSREPEELLLHFRSEVRMHEILTLSRAQSGRDWFVTGKTERGCFDARIRFREE